VSDTFDAITIPLTGIQLIEASAGTGKTYSITSLYLRLLLERRLGVEEILVVTFTEAATAELHERIRERLRAAMEAFASEAASEDPFLARLVAASANRELDRRFLLKAASDIDRAAVSTIHGFCQRILKQHALETGLPFDLELTGSTEKLLAEVADDYWVASFYDLDPRLADLVREKVSHGQFLNFAREVIRHRDYPVCTEASEPERDALFSRVQLCYDQARAIWLAEKERLASFFAEAQGLTAPFKALLAEGLLARISEFFSENGPRSFTPPRKGELLASSNIFHPKGEVFTATALKKNTYPDNPFFSAWEKLLEARLALARSCQALFLAEAAGFVRGEMDKRLKASRRQSFDELLTGLDRALQGVSGKKLAAAIRARFPAALIDEFQDTDPVQYRIFQAIYGQGRESLFLIGDPKQAIYAFRGADIYAYLNAAGRPGIGRHTMFTNWRADVRMVAAVNELFAAPANPFWEKRIAFAKVEPRPTADDLWRSDGFGDAPLHFLTLPEELCAGKEKRLAKNKIEPLIPELVAKDIKALLAGAARIGDRPVSAADLAVLVRTNSQAAEIQEALRLAGVAAVLQSKESVYKSPEAEECLRLLRAVADPGNGLLLRKALATPMLGFSSHALALLGEDDAQLQELMRQFAELQGCWQKSGVMQMFHAAWQRWRTCERLLALIDGERRLTNLRHLAELLQRAESENHLSPLMLIDHFAALLAGEESGEEAELRLESDEACVQLVTVHRSKGLEYPVVYCPYLCFASAGKGEAPYTVWHDPTENWQGRIALLPTAEVNEAAASEEFAESLRLLYVAVTRARHCCKLLWAPVSGYERSALAYLLHADPAAGEEFSLPAWRSLLKEMPQEELLDKLAARVSGNASWHLRELAEGNKGETGRRPERAGASAPACRTLGRSFPQVWRIGSFSHLTALEQHEETGREAEPHLPPDSLAEPAVEADIALAHFPKGPVAGNFFHRIFELLSFARQNSGEALAEVVGAQLRCHGYDADAWLAPVSTAFQEIFSTPLLAAEGFRLKDLDDQHCLRELAFTFPLGDEAERTRALLPALLASPFRDQPEALPAGYADALANLHFIPLRGFLKGFVDLVFAHRGRWYILDYKSNFLGASRGDYAAEKLAQAMASHHYYLQYHIYAVALHRYLAARLPGYDYRTHFGGVLYLFFKGMHPESGPASGVFYDRPPQARIEALSAMFARLASGELP